jgi:UDP-glucose 4-epimerase
VADSRLLRRLTGWQPRHDDLEFIIRTAWNWEQKRKAGGGKDRP